MELHAHELKTKFGSNQQIDDEVKNILYTISQDIDKAFHEDNRTCSRTELPTTFDIIGMNPSNAQIWIYNNVIVGLKKNGFESRILLGTKSWIKVTWQCDFDKQEFTQMKYNITNHIENDTQFWKD